LGVFCREMRKAVTAWYAENRHTPTVAENAPNVVRFRPEGTQLADGIPVIG
jgi:hypothetical protein